MLPAEAGCSVAAVQMRCCRPLQAVADGMLGSSYRRLLLLAAEWLAAMRHRQK